MESLKLPWEAQMEKIHSNTRGATPTFEEYHECYGEPLEVMRRLLLCHHCGGHLHFNHLTNFKQNLVQETARCPDCDLRVRNRIHKMQ